MTLGQPACMVDREMTALEVLTARYAPAQGTDDDITCKACRVEAGLDLGLTEEEEALEREAEADAAKLERAAKTKATRASKRKASKALDLTLARDASVIGEPQAPVFYKHRGEQVDGVLLADGTLRVAGVTHKTPSAAARAVTGAESNGWARWRFVAEADGKTYPIGKLRGDQVKSVRSGTKGRKRKAETAARKAERAQAKVARLEAKLAEVTAALEAARAEAAAAASEASPVGRVEVEQSLEVTVERNPSIAEMVAARDERLAEAIADLGLPAEEDGGSPVALRVE